MKDKIYYTEDIIDEVVKKGYDREMVEKFIKFYTSFLRKKIETTDEVAYYIPNLGTIYLTLTGSNYTLNILNRAAASKRIINNRWHLEKLIKMLNFKQLKIKDYITKLKDLGVKKISYFDKIYSSKHIKNA